MKISTKITAFFITLCFISIAITAFVVSWKSVTLSEQAIEKRAHSQLLSIGEAKKHEINLYFKIIEGQLITLTEMVGVKDAMVEFDSAYHDYPYQQVEGVNSNKLQQFYEREFGTKYSNLNNGNSANPSSKLSQLSTMQQAIQLRYIAENPNPAGSKHEFMADTLNTEYDQVHRQYHNSFKGFLEEFGYYDIFLVDTTGNVVYSVFKELDFATNLESGPYASSGLGEAFRNGLKVQPGNFYLADFAPYYPSYESVASFISAPIYKHGEVKGVLIFQMPIDGINNIMTFEKDWQIAGLGKTGESYLVGEDSLLRSESRFLIENKPEYLKALEKAGISPSMIKTIGAKSSAIGRQPITTDAAKQALSGSSGSKTVVDYRGIDVYSYYAPLSFAGLNWAIITEMDKAEALADVSELLTSIITSVVIVVVIILVVAALIAVYLGSSIAKPIQRVIETINSVAKNKDFTQEINVSVRGELKELSESLNELFSDLRATMERFGRSSTELNHTTLNISDNMAQSRQVVNGQVERTESVSTAVSEMTASISEVAQYANQAASFVKDANDTGNESSKIGANLSQDIEQLDQQMHLAVEALGRLNTQTASIAEVLDVIQGIAEQTNLLALNAAIEAARAGDQGRGFAVVADEVRSLASRTEDSTEEIRSKIDSLKKETEQVSNCITLASNTASKGLESCNLNTESLDNIVSMLEKLSDMAIQIATATEEQSSVTEEISRSITAIADASSSVSDRVNDVDSAINGLSNESERLRSDVVRFKF